MVCLDATRWPFIKKLMPSAQNLVTVNSLLNHHWRYKCVIVLHELKFAYHYVRGNRKKWQMILSIS